DDRRVELPQSEREDLGLELGHPDGGAYPVPRARAGERLERPFVGLDGDLAEPATGTIERLQHPRRTVVRYEEEDALPVAEVPLDVGAEVAVDDVGQPLRTFQLESELAPDEAGTAAGRDECRPRDRFHRTGRAVPPLERDTVGARAARLDQPRCLGPEADVD